MLSENYDCIKEPIGVLDVMWRKKTWVLFDPVGAPVSINAPGEEERGGDAKQGGWPSQKASCTWFYTL